MYIKKEKARKTNISKNSANQNRTDYHYINFIWVRY